MTNINLYKHAHYDRHDGVNNAIKYLIKKNKISDVEVFTTLNRVAFDTNMHYMDENFENVKKVIRLERILEENDVENRTMTSMYLT